MISSALVSVDDHTSVPPIEKIEIFSIRNPNKQGID
jgi:hypothetical protein